MKLQHVVRLLLTIPILPIVYWQAIRVKARIPKLPEAKGEEGLATTNSDDRIQVLLLGESTIAGVGVRTHSEGFAGSFARELAKRYQKTVDWKVYAKSGYTAQRVTERILPEISEGRADLVVIGLGANDAFELSGPQQWSRDTSRLIERLREQFPAATIVFCNMPPVRDFTAFPSLMKFAVGNWVDILGHRLESVVNRYPNAYFYSRKITLVDWKRRLNIEAETQDFFSDGVHPSRLTYQAWATDLAREVKDQGWFQA